MIGHQVQQSILLAFLKNFGAEIGAFASTWSFHENDMIVIGSNENDMVQ